MIRSHIPMPALRQLLRPVELSSSSGGGGPRAVSQVPVQIFLATLYPFLAAREANKYLRPDIFPAPPRVGPPRGKAPARRRKAPSRGSGRVLIPSLILPLLSFAFQWPFSPPRLYASTSLLFPSVARRLSRARATSRSFLDLLSEDCLIFWGVRSRAHLEFLAEIWSFSSCWFCNPWRAFLVLELRSPPALSLRSTIIRCLGNCGSFLHQFVFLLIFCVSASSLQFLKGKKFLFIEEQETQHWFHRIE